MMYPRGMGHSLISRALKSSGLLTPIAAVCVAGLTWTARPAALQDTGARAGGATLDDAQHLFYSGQYEAASSIALALRESDPQNLATFELRTSALLFQLKRAMGDAEDKDRAFKQCLPCPDLKAAFLEETANGRAMARGRLQTNPKDEVALFFLGKIDLNYIWLQLGTLGNRTGWNEYWEARKSLDAVLRANPAHVRAQVARAWIDYIVDTRMTRGFRWILGGGNKKRGGGGRTVGDGDSREEPSGRRGGGTGAGARLPGEPGARQISSQAQFRAMIGSS
jgi:hypothetical protein